MEPTLSTRHPQPLDAQRISMMVGQRLVIGFAGTQPDDPGVQDLRRRAEAGEVGGAIFFKYNVASPEQVRQLLEEMASWRCTSPFLTYLDQEGGRVQRLQPGSGFAAWPSAAARGQAGLAASAADVDGMAEELGSLGFHVNLAPVVDLFEADSPAIGALGRSFGAQVPDVVAHARQHIDAHARCGVASAIKHYPGHGSARGNTHHLGITDVTHEHRAEELEPFAELISAGGVDMVMTSHLVHRGMAPNGDPITLSRGAVHDVLRGRMGFSGVIISDDLCMGALVGAYGGLGQVIARAMAAGHDLVVVSHNAAARGDPRAYFSSDGDIPARAAEAVLEGIRAGQIDVADLAASSERVAAFKNKVEALRRGREDAGG